MLERHSMRKHRLGRKILVTTFHANSVHGNRHMLERLSMRKHRVGAKFLASQKVNVNKFDICLRNRINSTCMLFLSMYAFIILTMRLCAQCNSCPKRTK